MKIRVPATHWLGWFIIAIVVPILFGLCISWIIRLQPSDLWAKVFPLTVVDKPQYGLDVVIISKTNIANAWDFSAPTHYTYPDGKMYWLLPKENVDFTKGAISAVYAMDVHGTIYTSECAKRDKPRCLELEEFPWVPVSEEVQADIQRVLDTGRIFAEDSDVWGEIIRRKPDLVENPNVTVFAEAFPYPPPVQIDAVHWSMPLRLAALIATVLLGTLLMVIYTQGLGYWRVVFALATAMILVLLWIPYTMLLGGALPWSFGWISFLFWLGGALALGYLLIKQQPKRFWHWLGLTAVGAWLWRNALLLVVAVLLLHTSWPRFLQAHMTGGDSMRYILSALFIHDHGYWPLQLVADWQGYISHIANYPPGPAILQAYASWVVGAEQATMFFSGEQTGTIFYLYALLLYAVQLLFVAGLAFTVKALRPQNRWLWLVVVWLAYMFILTLTGMFSTGEGLLYPLFGMVLLVWVAWRKTNHPLAFILATVLTGIGLLIKNEMILLSLTIIIPWVIWCWPAQSQFRTLTKRQRAKMLGAAVMAVAPFALWMVQKQWLGIESVMHADITLSALNGQLGVYLKVLEQMRLFTLDDYASWLFRFDDYSNKIIILGLLVASLLASQRRWQVFLAGGGILGFCLLLGASYLFSIAPSIVEHVGNSWTRMATYPAIAALILAVVTIIEAQPEGIKRPHQ